GQTHCASHVPELTRGLRSKLVPVMAALAEQFGTAAEFDDPKGGIFLWVRLAEPVDTMKLYPAALAAGIAINPGAEWSTDKVWAKGRMRLCFAYPSHDTIRAGVAALAEVCRKEFGVPERIAKGEGGAGGGGGTRQARVCPGHPRLSGDATSKTWMAGTSPAMTRKTSRRSDAKNPRLLPRQDHRDHRRRERHRPRHRT